MFNIKLFYFLINYKRTQKNIKEKTELDIYQKFLNKKKKIFYELGLTLNFSRHLINSHDIMLLKSAFKHKLPKHILKKVKHKYIITISNNKTLEHLCLNNTILSSDRNKYVKINDVYSISKKQLSIFKSFFAPIGNSLYRVRFELLISDYSPSI